VTLIQKMSDSSSDQDFIFSLIDYLFFQHGISFFITSKDFDTLYNWWEKKIPEEIIRRSIDNVIKRRKLRNKPVDSFMNFSYEVRKNLAAKFELNINSAPRKVQNDPDNIEKRFFKSLHPGIEFLEGAFREVLEAPDSEKKGLLLAIYDKLITKYEKDEEMIIRTEIFMSNLPESMKKPEIVKKFRINYLNRRFRIPDFDESNEK